MTDTLLPSPPASPASPVAVLGAVTEAVGDLGATLWAARTAGELLDTIQSLERLRSVLDAVELWWPRSTPPTPPGRRGGPRPRTT